jgi:hypothetical protein
VPEDGDAVNALITMIIDWITDHRDELTEDQRRKLRALAAQLPDPGPADEIVPFVDSHGPKDSRP